MSRSAEACPANQEAPSDYTLGEARGRIRLLPVNLAEWLAQATAPLREAPFTHEIVLT